MLTPEMKEVLIAGKDRALVFGRDEQFVIVNIDEANASEAAYLDYRERTKGLPFAGVFGMVDGVATCRCATVEGIPVMILAGAEYARHIANKIKAEQAPRRDSLDWLERLWLLPDSRVGSA